MKILDSNFLFDYPHRDTWIIKSNGPIRRDDE